MTMRTFQLVRSQDPTGVSGTGVVADGVMWPDGTVSVRWRGARPSVVFWEHLDDAEAVHGHGGDTRVVWEEYGERNRLARALADAEDVRDTLGAEALAIRDDLVEKTSAHDQATVWLDLIAEDSCENYTSGPGTCTRTQGRYASARYGADRWCDPCRAWAALNDVPMTTQPEGEPDA